MGSSLSVQLASLQKLGLYPILGTLVLVWLASKLFEYRGKLQRVRGVPGFRMLLFHPMQIGAIFPHAWWNPSIAWHWHWRNWVYKRYQTETISFVPALLGDSGFFTSNLEVIKQIAGGTTKTDFYKPEAHSGPLLFWGMNLFAADGDMWRKHKRVLGPAFNATVYSMVWEETIKTYHDMSQAEGWLHSKQTDLPLVQTFTFKLALLIIGKCAFGFPFDYNVLPHAAGEVMGLQEAFQITGDSTLFSCFAPKWVQNLPLEKCMPPNQEAHGVVTKFIKEHITLRREEIAKGIESTAKDVFSMLLAANEAETERLKLDESELIGNIYIMMFAGHESTAHTLAATLALLSAHPEVQQDVYEQIQDILGSNVDPTFACYTKLNKVLAAFYEAVRMFSPGFIMIRQAKEDTVLQVPKPVGQEGYTSIPIGKGTYVMADIVGLQYNPRYFDEPEKFKPSRWYNVSNESEAFTAFSVGPRACIGRKFATTEAVAFLSMLLRDFEVRPLLSDKLPTVEKWKAQVLEAKFGITMGIRDVPITLVRRASGPA